MCRLFRSIIILCTFLLEGCEEKNVIRTNLYSFMDTEVVFPDKAFLVVNGTASIAEVDRERPVLVSFFGYKDCYECEIAHLNSKYSLFELADSLQSFHPLLIFAPEEGGMRHTLHNLECEQFPFPVYVTFDDEWIKNCGIPLDSRFHTFLLNGDNHPIFVGDPTATPALMNLFKNKLETMSTK